jgi:hypothetical protein
MRYSGSQHLEGYFRGYFDFQVGVLFQTALLRALTDTEIKKAKPREKAYRMSDSGGMYLWVTPSGGKLWQWGYGFEGKEKLMA